MVVRRFAFLALACLAALAPAVASRAQAPPPSDEQAAALNAGIQALLAGDHTGAEGRFRELLELSPEMAEAWLGLAESRRVQGDPEGALEAARKAQSLDPALAAAPLTVARALLELGSARDAWSELESALELDPDSMDALLLASLVLRELGSQPRAKTLLGEAWARGVRSAAMAEQLSILQLSSGAPEEALRIAEGGLATERRPSLLLARGLSLAAIPERRAAAVAALRDALDTGVLPEPGRVHLEVGGILVEEGRFDEALEHLEAARDSLGDEAGVFYQLALARRGLGDPEGAADEMARFEELSEASDASGALSAELGIALNEAQVLASQNRLEEAYERVGTLLTEHPDQAPVLALQAKLLFAMGRRADAEMAIARARELLPTHPEYHFLAGLFRMYAGLPVEAEEALRRAIRLDADLAPAHALLGGALAKQGRSEEAIVHFQRALDLGIDQPDVRLGYAGALEDLGRKSEANAQMEAYRRISGAN